MFKRDSSVMFAHQIFNEFKENTELSVRDVKSNGNGKLKGLKNSTNTAPIERIKSVSSFDAKSPSTFKKNMKKEISTATKEQASTISTNSENWPEIENMYIYNEPEDDYEDILPKSERITKAEMDCLFTIGRVGGYIEHNDNKLPTFELENIESFDEDIGFCVHHIIDDDLLFDDTCMDVPLPDFPFDDDTM